MEGYQKSSPWPLGIDFHFPEQEGSRAASKAARGQFGNSGSDQKKTTLRGHIIQG
jgi:hypothetical protein